MKTKWRIFFGAAVVFLLIYAINKINFPEAYQIIKGINPKFFLFAFVSVSLSIMVFSLRGMISLRKIIPHHDFWFFLETTLAGFFVNSITPGLTASGEPIRAYFLGEKYNKPKTKVFGALLADRILVGAVSLFFVIASLLFILTYIPVSEELKTIFQAALFFIFLLLGIIFFLHARKTRFNFRDLLQKTRILKKIKNNKKMLYIGQTFGNLIRHFKKTITDKKTLFWGVLFSFAYWILSYLSSYFLFLSLEVKVSFFLVIIVVSLGSLLREFSPSPGGAGFVEGLMIFLYAVLGVNLQAAIIVSVLSRLILYFHSLVLGGISILHIEKSLG